MISKIITGKSFKRLCEYLCKDHDRATIIGAEGVREYDYKLMAEDFALQASQNPNIKSPTLHMILSYYPGEVIANEKMVEIAKEYLEELGIKDTQVVIVRHDDRKHPHTHIVVNRVGNDGKTIKDNWIGLKGKKAAQQLTRKHGLKLSEKKTLELVNLERLNKYEATRYEIYQVVKDLLSKCKNLDELKEQLQKNRIDLVYKYKGQTNQVQGISFKRGEFRYKGSEVDRDFSYGKLIKYFIQSQTQKQGLQKELKKEQHPHLERYSIKHNSLLEQLMRPERDYSQTPYPLIKKKRKQQKRLGL